MEISNERIKEFQEAYRIDFGEAISAAEAREMLTRVVNAYCLLLRPLPGEESEGRGSGRSDA